MLEIGDQVFEQDTKNWQVSHTWALKSNVVNQFRVGRVEARADQRGIPCAQSDVDFLGLKGVFTGLPDFQRECPSIGIQGYAGTGGAVNAYSASNQPMWDIGNSTTYVAGQHNLNFGFNYRRWELQRDLATGFLGNYGFNVGFTGNPIADMLLGYYTNVGVFQPAAFSVPGVPGNPREFNFLYVAPYVQDDWKVSSRLTMNLGLRWDYRNTPYETRNRMAWRNLAYAPGGLLVADQTLAAGGITDGKYYQLADTRSPVNPDRFKVFAPRLGFAWRLTEDSKSVLRGGYGVFFDSAEGREIDGAADVYPYVSRGSYQQSLGQLAPLQTTDSLFPSFEAPGVATPAANTFLAVSQSPEPRNPYVQQWSLGVQRELFASTVLEVNYIGNKGTNLLMRRNIAQSFPYDPAHPSVEERRPFPNFGVYIDSDWSGRSNFNAFNTKLEHRGRSALLTFAYTWAKSTDTKSAAAGIGATGYNGWQGFLDNHDSDRDHGLSDFDVDHRLVGSFVYNLPFGSGERIAGDATGVKEAVVGGWQLNGIYTWQKGFPLTVQAADLGGLNDSFGANRADLIGDPNSGGHTILQWFNTAAFAQPAAGSFGTSGRNILRGPGVNNLDLALFKNFGLPGRMKLQFRLESFNALNHTQFSSVDTSLTSSTFGVVNGARAGRINQLGLKVLFIFLRWLQTRSGHGRRTHRTLRHWARCVLAAICRPRGASADARAARGQPAGTPGCARGQSGPDRQRAESAGGRPSIPAGGRRPHLSVRHHLCALGHRTPGRAAGAGARRRAEPAACAGHRLRLVQPDGRPHRHDGGVAGLLLVLPGPGDRERFQTRPDRLPPDHRHARRRPRVLERGGGVDRGGARRARDVPQPPGGNGPLLRRHAGHLLRPHAALRDIRRAHRDARGRRARGAAAGRLTG